LKAEVTEVTSGSAIGETGGDIGAVDLVESHRDRIVRDITIKARDSVHIPSVFNKAVAPAVAEGVARAAHATGVAARLRMQRRR